MQPRFAMGRRKLSCLLLWLLIGAAIHSAAGCGLRQGKNSNGYHFLGGKYIQIGVAPNGKFLGYAPYPAGFLCCGDSTAYRGALGLVGDADGFCNGVELAIDYFFPGSPAERFNAGFMLDGAIYQGTGEGFASSVSSGISEGKVYADIIGTLNGNLKVRQYVSFSESDTAFTNLVTLTNVGVKTLTKVRFSREFDPDNTVFKSGASATINKVEATFAIDGRCRVSGTSLAGDYYNSISGAQAIVFLESSDPSCRAGFGGWYPSMYGSWLYDSPLARGFTYKADDFIGIAFNRDSLAPGESWTFTLRTALTEVCTSNAQCLNGGVCFQSACNCAAGWGGGNCEADVNECNSNPPGCVPGSCVNTLGAYTCTCAKGYTWDPVAKACKDTEPPTVTCPANIVIPADTGKTTASRSFAATATDNLAVTSGPSCDHSPVLPLGPTTIACTAKDAAGNEEVCTFEVTVKDEEKPVVMCPPSITQNTDPGVSYATVSWAAPPTASDNVGVIAAPSCNPSTKFMVGTKDVVCTASDAAGNEGSCSFEVQIKDAEPPKLTCPPDMKIGTDAGTNVRTLDSWTVVASDNVDVDVAVTCTRNQGSKFSLGSTTVTCTALDAAGLEGSCSFQVVVEDQEAPVITCPANVDLVDLAVAEWPVPTAEDNVAINSGSLQCKVDSSPKTSGSSFPVGSTRVDCSIQDTAGNQGDCNFYVTVKDSKAPTVTCPKDVIQATDESLGTASVTYGTATATDNLASSVDPVCSPATGSSFSLGLNTVLCSATDDAGNTGTCAFSIEVVDKEAPILTCPANKDVNTDLHSATAIVEWVAATATDNVGVTVLPTCGRVSPSAFGVGTSTVECSAADAAGNIGRCSFDITVTDKEAPMLSCPADVTQTTDAGQKFATVTLPSASPAPDNVDKSVVPECVAPDGAHFQIGITPVTCKATDTAGNIASCPYNVEVIDLEAPKLVTQCPARIKQMSDEGKQYATVFWTVPEFSDNVGVAEFQNSKSPGDTFPHGTTVVLHKVLDAAGNQANCTFKVTVSASSCGKASVFNSLEYNEPHSLAGIDGEVLPVTCHAGYTKSNGAQGPSAVCKADGTWSSPTCTPNACAATQVPNSNKAAAGSITGNTGDRVRVNCNKGYVGSGWMECGIDGTFSPLVCTERCASTVTVPVSTDTATFGFVAMKMNGRIFSVTTTVSSSYTISDLYVNLLPKGSDLVIGAPNLDWFPYARKKLEVSSYTFSDYIANLGVDCDTFASGTVQVAVYVVAKTVDGRITLTGWAKGASKQNTNMQFFSVDVPCDCTSSNSIFVREALLAAATPFKVQVNLAVVKEDPKFAVVAKSTTKTLSTGRYLLQTEEESPCDGVLGDQAMAPSEDGLGWILDILTSTAGEFAICITGVDNSTSPATNRRTKPRTASVDSTEYASSASLTTTAVPDSLKISGPIGIIINGQSCMSTDTALTLTPYQSANVDILAVGAVPENAWWMITADQECVAPKPGFGARAFGPGPRSVTVPSGEANNLAICYLHQGVTMTVPTCAISQYATAIPATVSGTSGIVDSSQSSPPNPTSSSTSSSSSSLGASEACACSSSPNWTWTIGLGVGIAIVIVGCVAVGFWYRSRKFVKTENVLFDAPSVYTRMPQPDEAVHPATLQSSFVNQVWNTISPRSRNASRLSTGAALAYNPLMPSPAGHVVPTTPSARVVNNGPAPSH